MKILLTGKPGIGKSTVIQNFLKKYQRPWHGFVSREIRIDDQRVGFEACNAQGVCRVFSHKDKFADSPHAVGKFHVDIGTIESFMIPEIENGVSKLCVIDEIGRMQALSQSFLKVVESQLNSPGNILGTIVFDPEQWAVPLKNIDNVPILEVTENNRENLPDELIALFSHAE